MWPQRYEKTILVFLFLCLNFVIFPFMCVTFAKPPEGEETCYRWLSKSLRVINALCYFLRYEYNRTTFLYVWERDEGWFYLKKQQKKEKNRSWNPIYISGYHPCFLKKSEGKSRNIQKRVSAREFRNESCVCVWVFVECVRIQRRCSFVFSSCLNCFPSKYSQPCQLTEQVSSGSAAWMRARLAWTKVLIQALVHCKEYSSVCVMCRCVFERPRCFVCVCCSREREKERERPDGVFSHTLGRFIHPSLRWAHTLTHTQANTHLGAVSRISYSTPEQHGN